MPATARPSAPPLALWTGLVGGILLAALGVYGLATTSGASPRYAAALIALGLAGVARAVSARSSASVLDHTTRYLTGIAFGLLVAGFVG